MNIIEIHRIDENNPGDFYSNPCRYFFSNLTTKKLDVDNIKKASWHQKDTIIVGGGGLLGNDNFEPLMQRLSTHPDEQVLEEILETKLKNISNENKELLWKWKEVVQSYTLNVLNGIDRTIGPRILWGAGINSKDLKEDSYSLNYPSYITKFHLVGVRDWDTDYRWVPCVSCMHPAFDKKYEIKNEVVWFEHKKRLIDNKWMDLIPAPRILNTGQNFDQIIEFLGSAETVVTNSYHGVYWATLLGKKVVCIPWSSKFNMFKHPPIMANDRNWHVSIQDAISYPDALTECRNANKLFAYDAIQLIKSMSEDDDMKKLKSEIDLKVEEKDTDE